MASRSNRSSSNDIGTNGLVHELSRIEIMDPMLLHRYEQLVANLDGTRTWPMRGQGRSWGDPRRSIEDECGYPRLDEAIDPEVYAWWYERHEIAGRVIEVFPRECWQVQPIIREKQSKDTPFLKALEALPEMLSAEPSWHEEETGQGGIVNAWLQEADIRAGIGHYSVILCGYDDGRPLSEPVRGVREEGSFPMEQKMGEGKFNFNEEEYTARSPRPVANEARQWVDDKPWDKKTVHTIAVNQDEAKGKNGLHLKYLRVFDESMAQVTQWEMNKFSPRYRQPKMYLITMTDDRRTWATGQPGGSEQVHWTRVVHLTNNVHPVFSPPRCKAVHNRLMALALILGADGETFWKNCSSTTTFETHPQHPDIQVDEQQLKWAVEQEQNSQQKYLLGIGGTWKKIAPTVADPTQHVDSQIRAICIRIGCPLPVFMGYEIGEQASTENRAKWAERVKGRQYGHLSPNHLAKFYNRQIWLGVLPKPDKYSIEWPDLSSQSDAERATVLNSRTTAFQAYVQGGVEALMTPIDYLTREAGYDEDEAEAILAEAAKAEEEAAKEQQALADEQGMLPAPPDGFEKPQPEQPLAPIKVREGEALVTPDGKKIAAVPKKKEE